MSTDLIAKAKTSIRANKGYGRRSLLLMRFSTTCLAPRSSRSHFSPLSGNPDRPENYHTVTIRLTGSSNSTEVSLSQDNNADEKAWQESEKNWEAMLDGLKRHVEKSSGL